MNKEQINALVDKRPWTEEDIAVLKAHRSMLNNDVLVELGLATPKKRATAVGDGAQSPAPAPKKDKEPAKEPATPAPKK